MKANTVDNKIVGTGFVYMMTWGNKTHLLLVSNKHVLSGARELVLDFCRASPEGKRLLAPAASCTIFEDEITLIEHPEKDVDLAGLWLKDEFRSLRKSGNWLSMTGLQDSLIPPPRLADELYPATDILMTGYPNGYFDAQNTLPITRKGILSSHYVPDFMGQKEFLVDMAALPGSSGSPVFAIFDKTNSSTGENFTPLPQKTLWFIGILTQYLKMKLTGETTREQITSIDTESVVGPVPMHLGVCIKSHRVKELQPLFQRVVRGRV